MQLTDAIVPVAVLGGIFIALIILDRYIANHTRKKD